MDELPTTKVLRLERQGFYLTATIDDPATRNAMTEALVSDLEALLAASREDRTLRALVLKGTDGSFCAGADLKGPASPPPGREDKSAAWRSNRRGGDLFDQVNRHPMAVIAVVDGPAFGGGFGLVCCADIVICTERARFSLSETSLGLAPAQIAPFVVSRIGLSAARRLALTGARFGAQVALELGLADVLVDDVSQAEAALTEVLTNIGRCAPGANAATKALLLECGRLSPGDYADLAADTFTNLIEGPEGREGLQAFAEKRPPSWCEGV